MTYDQLKARNICVKGETDKERDARVEKSDAEISVAAASLSRMVLAPVAGRFGNKRLMIVADDVLHFVPFGALPVPKGGASSMNRQRRVTRPLIEDHEIVKPAFSLNTGSAPRGSVGASKGAQEYRGVS